MGLVIFFMAFFSNEFFFAVAVAAVSVGMVYEAVNAIKPGKMTVKSSVFLSIVVSLSAIFIQDAACNIKLAAENPQTVDILKTIVLLAFMFVYLLFSIFLYMLISVKEFKKTDVHKIYSSAFMTLYISTFMAFIMFLRFDYGRYAVLPVFIFSWITDTGAYFVGNFFGKHKMAPNLSPKKTVEGAIGGIITTVIGAGIYLLVLKYAYSFELPNNVLFLVSAGAGAVLSELGDLSASALKRRCNVKDFGKIFPGHGGFLDRFDSVVFISPYVYFVFLIMEYSPLIFR